MHTGADHWIAIEILSEEVWVYDSMYLKPIASIVKSKHCQINISVAKVQFQKTTVDCGVYALAFLTDLCHGINPNTRVYASAQELQKHLICFEQGTMSLFPSTACSRLQV